MYYMPHFPCNSGYLSTTYRKVRKLSWPVEEVLKAAFAQPAVHLLAFPNRWRGSGVVGMTWHMWAVTVRLGALGALQYLQFHCYFYDEHIW
jgi:hypothetical protein